MLPGLIRYAYLAACRPSGPYGVHEGDWEHISLLVCAEDETIQQASRGRCCHACPDPGAVDCQPVAWDCRQPGPLLGNVWSAVLCACGERSFHMAAAAAVALQTAYSQHGWWETRDCTQPGQCPMEADDVGVMHPGKGTAAAAAASPPLHL